MKEFYANDQNYTNSIVLMNRRRYLKGLKPIQTIKAFVDIDKLKASIQSINKKRNIIEKRKVLSLIEKSTNKLMTREQKSNQCKEAYQMLLKKRPNIKHLRADGLRKAHDIAKQKGICFFSDETRKKFAITACKRNGNLLGAYIIETTSIDYSLINKKIKKLLDKEYKNKDNMIKQIERIRVIISNETDIDVPTDVFIDYIKHSRLKTE